LYRPGEETVILLTDLLDATRFPATELLELYLARWSIAVSRVTRCLSNRWKSGRGKRSAPRSWDGRVGGNLSPEAHRQNLRKEGATRQVVTAVNAEVAS
jgi:hypothetical protein